MTRAWLGDFGTALPAVGVIGAWVLLGLCTVLLLAGMSKIDPALYEAAQLDGAGRVARVRLDHAAEPAAGDRRLRHRDRDRGAVRFDIVYISTQGGPGNATMVPGLQIYQLAFSNREVGLASALAVVLMVLVLVCILPIQWLTRRTATDDHRAARGHGRAGCCSSS